MSTQHDVVTEGGRLLRCHDSGAPSSPQSTGALGDRAEPPTLIWHHGSPQTGALLAPVLAAATTRGFRLVSYARPSYPGSGALPGRDVASAAADVAAVADALGITDVAVMGASGGGPHALACAALLGSRVTAAVAIASPAPRGDDWDWFAGMVDPGGLRAALDGRDARARQELAAVFNPEIFTAADWAALDGPWAALNADVAAANAAGADGLIDDDVAFAAPWGFDLSAITAPVLLVHGAKDRVVPLSHTSAIARALPAAEVWVRQDDGHLSVLEAVPEAITWVLGQLAGD